MAIADELVAVLGYEVRGEEALRRYQQSLDNLHNKLTNFAAAAGRVAAVISGAAAAGFAALGKSAISTNAQFEGYLTSMETIEGSAEKARASMDWIKEFAKKTPYELEGVTEAFIALKGYGIDPIANDALRRLGDMASAMNKPLSQAVEAFADASTFEFERLKEFGIRAKQEGDKVTFSWTENGKELSKSVKKTATDVRAFLLDVAGKRFGGAMDRQSKTFNGMMSNLKDSWTDFQRRIGEKGFFESIKSKLSDTLDQIGRLDREGKLDRWAQGLSDALTKVSNVFWALADRTAQNVEWLADNFDKLRGPLTWLGVALALLIARAFPLITLFTAIGLGVDDLFAYLQGGESYIADFISWVQKLTGVSEGVAQSLAGLVAVVATALAAAFLFAPLGTIKAFGSLLFAGLAALAPVVGAGLKAALFLLTNPVGWAVLLAGAAAGLIWYFWDELKGAWDSTSSRAVEIFTGLKDSIANIDWAGVGTSIMSAIWTGMKAVGAQIRDWFISIIPEWARKFIAGDGAGAVPSTPATPTSTGAPQVDRSLPPGQSGSTPLTTDALDAKLQAQQQEWNRVMGNLNGNLQKMVPDKAVSATITDSRQDNRQFPFTSNVTVNQTVTQATSAPGQAAQAVGQAVSGAVAGQRTQVETGPAF